MNTTNNDRSYIESGSVTIYGRSGGRSFPRTFAIEKKIAAGGSSITYSADFNGKGVLKEFFPMGFETLGRDENDKPVCGETELERFQKRLKNYVYPYNVMTELRRDENIAGFIPPFELYTGNEDGSGSVYIWTPQPQLLTFGQLCEEVRKDPSVQPEYKLTQILYAIESLAECIDLLHRSKLVHCDIKPSNFGFLKRGGKVLYGSISLFDIDSISYIFDKDRPTPCSEGFTAPEISGNNGIHAVRHDFSSDMYSIGAVLCYALSEEGGTYIDPGRGKTEEIVNGSKLISASPANEYPELRETLVKILNKTLCPKDSRYDDCGQLLEDIRRAQGFIIPAAVSEQIETGKEWMLTDVEKYLDKNIISMAIQRHLYKNPLYMSLSEGSGLINLLIAGLDRYGALFLDTSLQISQIPGKRLRVTVIADSAQRDTYLKNRPELDKFFNIDGALKDDPGTYGDINFVCHAPTAVNTGLDLPEISSAKPDYIFVSAGWDANISIARSASERFPGKTVSFTGIKKTREAEQAAAEGLIPVYIGEASDDEFSEFLERAGFNTHIVWNNNLNIDFSDKKREYRQAYNHDSSTGFALSIKYKLYGTGIDMDKLSVPEIITRYKQYISNKKSKNMLVCLEHRRWVTEKLCLGYTSIPDLNDCANGRPKDEAHKRHGCIVRSDSRRRLLSYTWRRPDGSVNHTAWNDPPKQEYDSLDPLEKMSVDLHRVYKKHADMEASENLLNGGIVSAIRASIDSSIETVSAFQELITCMKDIFNDENGSTGQHRLYSSLKKRFESALKDSDIDDRAKESVKKLSDSLAGRFYPVCESRKFHDYKDEDLKLVECLPFILTYSEKICMVLPYSSGSSTDIFSNLTAPTIVNPGRIIYTVYCDRYRDALKIKDELGCVSEYMERKHLHGTVEFVIGHNSYISEKDCRDIEDGIKKAGGGKVKKVKFIQKDNTREFAAAVKAYLDRISRGGGIMIEMRDIFDSTGFFDGFPRFRYDRTSMKLININGCEVVEQINAEPSITVNDMFSFRKAVSTTSNKPEFPDFKEMWGLYSRNTGIWKHLCGRFREYSEKNDIIAVFTRKEQKTAISGYNCLIPFSCRTAAQRLIDELISEEIIGENSGITRFNSDICHVRIEDIYGNKPLFDSLFSKAHVLMNADYISFDTNTRGHIVKVMFNDLCVHELDCAGLYDYGYKILSYFRQKGYFINYTRNGDKISFTYASKRIKELLVTEGRFLEVYTYHSAYALHAFSDIRSGFEITWDENIAKNELDCILTKGFSSVFVECKATNDIKREYYMKLAHLVDTFGVNAKAVVVIDASDLDLEKLRSFSKEFDIITVCRREDIDNIGSVLLQIAQSAADRPLDPAGFI